MYATGSMRCGVVRCGARDVVWSDAVLTYIHIYTYTCIHIYTYTHIHIYTYAAQPPPGPSSGEAGEGLSQLWICYVSQQIYVLLFADSPSAPSTFSAHNLWPRTADPRARWVGRESIRAVVYSRVDVLWFSTSFCVFGYGI